MYYNKHTWRNLNLKHTPHELKNIMSKAIIKEKIPFPYEIISLTDAKNDFDRLKTVSPVETIAKTKWFSKFDYSAKKLDLCLLKNNAGKKSSNKFTQKERYKVDHRAIKSSVYAWHDPHSHHSMLSPLWTIGNVKEINPDTLRKTITMRKYLASQFRPVAAKALYETLGGGRILDFSSGWGDRLVGALSTSNVVSYTGVDPNSELHKSYKKIIETYPSSVKVETIEDCAETVDYGKRMFDVVFTSPPYFNVEKYNGKNSSWKTFKTHDAWLNGFLFPAISNAWKHLVKGGTLAINISDVQNNGRISLCDKMVDFVKTRLGGECKGYIGYQMSKFPGQQLVDRPEGLYGEPIFLFVK
jgi:hypothetical protein